MKQDPKNERALADLLERVASHVDIGSPSLDDVVLRGRQRQQRRATAVGVLTVGAVCTVALVGINLLSRQGSSTPAEVPVTEDRSETDVDTASRARLVESNLVWNRVDIDSTEALGFVVGNSIIGDGPFLAWSTAPAPTQNWEGVLWRSDDGRTWQLVDDPPLLGLSAGMGALAASDGRFFAYGTTAATSAAGRGARLTLATSSDGGFTWSSENLPVETSDLLSEPGIIDVRVGSGPIAAGPHGVLAVARITVTLDPNVLPPEANAYGYRMRSDGIEVFGCISAEPLVTIPDVSNDSMVAATTTAPPGGPCQDELASTGGVVTWAQLGLSDRAAAALRTPNHYLYSPDGVTFHEMPSPSFAADMYADVRLTSYDGGLAVWVTPYSPYGQAVEKGLYVTTDGTTWTDLHPAPIAYPNRFEGMGDRLVLTGAGAANDSMVAVLDPDGSWTITHLDDLIVPTDGIDPSLESARLAAGGPGIALVGILQLDPIVQAGGLDVTRGGITAHADDSSGALTFSDASGTVVGATDGGTTTGRVERDGETGDYRVRDEAGAEVATFSIDELYKRVDSNSRPPQFILHTADGVSWSRESLSELAGAPVSGTSSEPRMVGAQIIVPVTLAEKNPDGTQKQILLLGTPRS